MTVELFYNSCLGVGLGYALLTSVFGWLFDHGDGGGGDVQVDATGHLDAGHISPVSGTSIATFITGFGAGGTLAHNVLDWNLIPGMLLAAGSGLTLAGAAFVILDFIFVRTQAGSEYVMADVVGNVAEVITPIREDALGEIAYVVKGQRERMSARASDGVALAKGTLVIIESLTGATAYVRRKS